MPLIHSKAKDACTLSEALAFRKRLREVGDDQFIIETLEAGVITAKKLCTAFGILPPAFLEGAPDVFSRINILAKLDAKIQ